MSLHTDMVSRLCLSYRLVQFSALAPEDRPRPRVRLNRSTPVVSVELAGPFEAVGSGQVC